MKQGFMTICLMSIIIGLASCHKDNAMEQKPEQGDDVTVWETSELSAYIGDINYLPEELRDVIHRRFPLKAGIESANVIFVGTSELSTNYELLRSAAAAGKYIVIPGTADYTILEGDAEPTISLSDSEENTPLFYCYTGWGEGNLYAMYNESAPLQSENGESSLTDEQWKELEEMGKADGLEYESTPSIDINHGDLTDYYQSRIDPFVKWVDNSFHERAFDFTDSPNYNDLRVNIEQAGKRLTYNYNFELYKFIDQATGSDPDYLHAYGSITIDFRIYPIYMNSTNGDAAGDYYGVISTITPHNASMWRPYCASHGWTRNRIYGYWFEGMSVTTRLTDHNGSPISGLDFFQRPIPENKNDSKTYSNGHSFSLTGSVSGGYSAGKPYVVGQVGVGGTWTSSTNYTLETINYELNTSSSDKAVKYNYTTDNVELTDDWDDWTLINRNFPAPVRTEFSAHTMWVWYVPGTIATDRSDVKFRLNTKVDLTYASWYHWRASVSYDSNKKTYGISVPSQYWILEHPNRIPWGFIKLRNASSEEMANVKFYDIQKEGGDEQPVATLSTSYGSDDVVKIALPVGTYDVTWDLVDGDTGEKISSWKHENIKVNPGKDEESASTEISSINGTKID